MENGSLPILEKIADNSGVAVIVVDADGRQLAAVNDNSVCSVLFNSAEFGHECARFCGRAFALAENNSGNADFRCHAGLSCHASILVNDDKKAAAIVGRVFTRAEDYRRLTQRSIYGDLQQFSSNELFENVLIGVSEAAVREATDKFHSLSENDLASIVSLLPDAVENPETDILGISDIDAVERPHSDGETVLELDLDRRLDHLVSNDIAAWRSIFGSFLQLSYKEACEDIVAFLAKRYDLESILWLERKGNRLETIAGLGRLNERVVKIAIAADEPLLAAAGHEGSSLELTSSKSGSEPDERLTINLFPLMIGDEVRGSLAVGGPCSRELSKHLSQFCRMVASRIEILRLRHEVARRDSLSDAVRRFNDNLQKIDGVDFWLHLTQVSAELLHAERASLLMQRSKSNILRPMASIGIRADLASQEDLGGRVARVTLEHRKPLLVKHLERSNIVLAPVDHRYRTDSFISYPIEIGDRGIAVLNLTDKVDGAEFNEYDLEVLRAITPQIAVAIDRTQLREQAGAFAQLSVTDPLTGLLNRRYLETRLEEEISRSDRHSFMMSFMMLDVDEFKSYNDHFGHPAGDEALKIVGHVVKETVRAADVAARYGGEEFAVLLPQTTLEEAELIAERLRQRIEETQFPYRPVTISIGIASCSPSPTSSARALIEAADKALYRAKQAGRNNVQIFGDLEPALENFH